MTVNGQLIASDPNADVALVEIAVTGLSPVPIARSTDSVDVGDEVFSVTADPIELHRHTVTRINPYQGPSTIECTGMPVVGRSGAGLFNVSGELIGVCFAANRSEQTGIYAGLSEVLKLVQPTFDEETE